MKGHKSEKKEEDLQFRELFEATKYDYERWRGINETFDNRAHMLLTISATLITLISGLMIFISETQNQVKAVTAISPFLACFLFISLLLLFASLICSIFSIYPRSSKIVREKDKKILKFRNQIFVPEFKEVVEHWNKGSKNGLIYKNIEYVWSQMHIASLKLKWLRHSFLFLLSAIITVLTIAVLFTII